MTPLTASGDEHFSLIGSKLVVLWYCPLGSRVEDVCQINCLVECVGISLQVGLVQENALYMGWDGQLGIPGLVSVSLTRIV